MMIRHVSCHVDKRMEHGMDMEAASAKGNSQQLAFSAAQTTHLTEVLVVRCLCDEGRNWLRIMLSLKKIQQILFSSHQPDMSYYSGQITVHNIIFSNSILIIEYETIG